MLSDKSVFKWLGILLGMGVSNNPEDTAANLERRNTPTLLSRVEKEIGLKKAEKLKSCLNIVATFH